jgi:hypothetical protein
MNAYKLLYFTVGFFFMTNSGWAEDWKCIARDAANKEWRASSNYERVAINHAFELCKKESTLPSSCKTSKQDCEAFIDGVSTRPLWRCIALDQMGKPWESNLYSQRDDAALAAKAYCQDQSGFPDTCYINLMTCRNLNLRD